MSQLSTATYRIRGLPEGPATSPKPALPVGETTDPTALLGRVLRSLSRPHLTDLIYHAKFLPRLAAHWPTFSYFITRSKCSALKDAPIHLGEYMDFSTKDEFCQQIIDVADYQHAEEKAIRALLSQVSEGSEVAMIPEPLAMALACHLYRGSEWLKQNQNEILKTILQSSSAAYIALCSGFFQGDVTELLTKISEDPRLTLDVSQSPALQSRAEEKWFLAALEPYPVQHSMAVFLNGHSQKGLELLHQAAGTHAISAGICLGLEPASERADDWLAIATGSTEAFYWMGKVWTAGRREIATHPHRLTAITEIRRDLRWHYHWARDVAPEEASMSLSEIWPSPWAVELILDLGIPIGLVPELYNQKELDPKHPADSAVLLWAADNTLSST